MPSKLSYANNCLVYSAILRNGTEADIALLQNLRSVTNPSQVSEYYTRSADIIKLITDNPEYNEAYWDLHYTQYITDILASLKSNNADDAIGKILAMLDSLESELRG